MNKFSVGMQADILRKKIELSNKNIDILGELKTASRQLAPVLGSDLSGFFDHNIDVAVVSEASDRWRALFKQPNDWKAAYHFSGADDREVCILLDFRAMSTAVGWAIERVLQTGEQETSGGVIIDRYLAKQFAAVIAKAYLSSEGTNSFDEKVEPLLVSAVGEPERLNFSTTEQPVAMLVYQAVNEMEENIGAVSILFKPVLFAAQSKEQCDASEENGGWSAAMERMIMSIPVPVRAVQASKTLDYHALSGFSQNDLAELGGAVRDAVILEAYSAKDSLSLARGVIAEQCGMRSFKAFEIL